MGEMITLSHAGENESCFIHSCLVDTQHVALSWAL